MYKTDKIIYSPSDLVYYSQSQFISWMDRFAIENKAQAPSRDTINPLLNALAKKGLVHEQQQMQKFLGQGLAVIEITGKTSAEKYTNTIKAIHQGADVIAQARLQKDKLAGFADFLVKVDTPSQLGNYSYTVWDTKLATASKPKFLVQLCCYAQMLETIQGVLPKNVCVALGNGECENFLLQDCIYFVRQLQQEFFTYQQQFNSEHMPCPGDFKEFAHWSEYASQVLLDKDHLSQVAGINRKQIKKLNQAGIHTMAELATGNLESVKGINLEVLTKLQQQAYFQDISRDTDLPQFKVIENNNKFGLAHLPPHCSADIFFDIEGYPLEENLEYLWGITYFNDAGEREFKDFWAHTKTEEKQAFSDFISWTYKRWQDNPNMHIYHYANYEIAACTRLAAEFGVYEYEVDNLLRNHVFIDLYSIVKNSIILGADSYSIKKIELLYRGKRNTNVGNGGDSVIVYDNWRTLHSLGQDSYSWEKSDILNDIRQYNIDDCNSTQELVVWLRNLQQEHCISYQAPATLEHEISDQETAVSQLRQELLTLAKEQQTNNNPLARVSTTLAGVLEFHKRENKPVWWRLFARQALTHAELIDDLDCLANCQRTAKEAFKPTPRSRHLAYEYTFDSQQEFKAAHKNFYILGALDENSNPLKAEFLKEYSDLAKGIIVLKCKQEPDAVISLIADEYINPRPIPETIFGLAQDYLAGTLIKSNPAIYAFLQGDKPRFNTDYQLKNNAIVDHNSRIDKLEQIIHAALALDSSYLIIQGPPGTGKSYTAKHIIATLLQKGLKVGITSNSHKAINHLLISTAKHCREHNINAKFACSKGNSTELAQYQISIIKNDKIKDFIDDACVVATTAWGFARNDLTNEFDYLFVDEAGQVPIANLIATSDAARNLILLGDQMQLPQPIQASHPDTSGVSVLDYLLEQSPIVSGDMGVFLDVSYRMHSKINTFISNFIYAGKLQSHPTNDARLIKFPPHYTGVINKQAGIVYVPVTHAGNTQAAMEEVNQIKLLVNDLLTADLHLSSTNIRKLKLDDMLFVAPYNHQVNKLQTALGTAANVGSVDKFQGQEAAVVIISMCASNAADAPRGIEFLLNKNRLNVAISRAQVLTIIVASDSLTQTHATKMEHLKLLNLFNAVIA